MNAKLAVAISLGASSLALFGMAGVANAATPQTTGNDTNPPVVKPSTDDPVKKAKGEAQKAVDEANEQKKTVTKEVEDAESEVKDANSKAIDANKEVTEAQTELENKRKEAKTAEEEKGKADKELDDQKTAVDTADKEVKDKKAVLDQETANQTAAENKLKAAQDEKGKAEGELNTEKEAVKAKETEHAQAGEKVKTEKGKLDTANTQLEKAKKDKQDAQVEANQLSSEADQKEQAQKEAEQAVTENTEQQENIQKQIDNLKAAGSGTTNADVKELEKKANEAKQAYEEANNTETQKAQEAQKATDAIAPKAEELNNVETALKQNENYKNNIASFDQAADDATKKYNEEYNKEKLDPEVEKGFEGFLEYIISTEKAKTDGSRNEDLIADAERAQKILRGETFKSTYTEIKIGEDTYGNPAKDMKAPIWADYVKKLRRVGGADSLQNLKEAATYYDALNKVRNEERAGLPTVGVRLSLIAESIIHSFYSASIQDHAANFDMEHNVNPNSPEQLKSHAYDDSSENLAWGEFDGNDSNRAINKKGTMSIDINSTSNIAHSSTKSNAMDGWYYKEKDIYDGTLSSNSFGGKTLTAEGKTFLQEHRYDFLDYASAGLSPTLFNDDSDKSIQDKFQHAVGHYLNFVSTNNTAAGFAEADTAIKDTSFTVTETSNGTRKTYNKNGTLIYDIAVWHGNSEKTISVDTYKDLLNSYINKVTDNGKKNLEPANSRNLADLAAKENVADIKLFDSVYKVITSESNNSQTGANTVTELIKKVITAKKNFEEARDNASAANKAKEEAANKATELKTAWTTAQNAYEAAKQKAQQAADLNETQRTQKIQKLQNDLNGLKETAKTLKSKAETAEQTAKAARTAAKTQQAKVDGELTNAITAAETNVESAKQAVATAEAAKKQADTELQKANDKVTNLKQTIQTLEAQITAESKKVDEAKSEVQAARAALDGAKDTQNTVTTQLKALQTKAQNADETVKNTKSAVEVAKKAVVEKIKLAQTAVANAQAKVKTAQEVVEAAKTKIETIQKNLEAAETKFKAVVTDQTTQQSFMQSTFLAAYQSFESFVQTLTEKVNTLKTTAATLTESAKTLATQLPESVVTPSVVPPVVPPAPKPPVVVPSHGESDHGSTGNTGSTTNTGNTENAGSTGNNNVPFIPQTPHVSVPAVDVEQQSNEFASTTAENYATQAVVKSETGKSTKAEHANKKASVKNAKANTQHTQSTSSATSTSANQNSAQSHDANKSADNKNAENKKNSESKQEDNKQETQDSNNNNSTQNNESQKGESKNSQASGNPGQAQKEGNKTLTVAAIVASAIAGIAAIGGGITFARHRRM